MNNEALTPYFANLPAWPWLTAALIVCAAAVYAIAMRRRALAGFAANRLLGFLAPFVSWPRQYIRMLLVTLATLCIGIALLGPRWGVYFQEAHARHLDLMICLDVSRSMLAEDAGMSRLARAKDDIHRLLDRMAGASVGLVVFAGSAELASPLTDDYEFYRMELEDVGPHSVTVGGTNIGKALAAARRAFGPPAARDRAIILMTDGEDHGGTAVDEAREALKDRIQVFAIGIGDDDRGALIPIERDGRQTFLQYNQQQVWSKLDPKTLQAVAQAGGGEYHPSGQVSSRERTLDWIYSQKLAPRQHQAQSQQQVEQRHHRSHWFAAVALALLTIDALMRDRRSTPIATEVGATMA